jgi:hypothetical protein
MFPVIRLLLAAAALAAGFADAQPARPLLGRTVQSVIEELRSAGTPLVYSSGLLPGALTVSSEPSAADPLDLAREILAPHGLTLRAEGGAWLVVRDDGRPAQPGGIVVDAGGAFSGTPLASFSVQVEGPTPLTVSGADGRAELPALARRDSCRNGEPPQSLQGPL